ncbi:hypothetical protein BDN71DRAFT_1499392 [Pleurotus eryngii]|uniref:Uncharacterized protein n=1 Tax=Pleurotus eryngii TaxID=5323 RepID=A0A9P5ZLV6_PLEER|nr:hypothetical protein BDN71DRAFT_1499392 [Pleurotus eryngii]
MQMQMQVLDRYLCCTTNKALGTLGVGKIGCRPMYEERSRTVEYADTGSGTSGGAQTVQCPIKMHPSAEDNRRPLLIEQDGEFIGMGAVGASTKPESPKHVLELQSHKQQPHSMRNDPQFMKVDRLFAVKITASLRVGSNLIISSTRFVITSRRSSSGSREARGTGMGIGDVKGFNTKGT